ncbi:MAG: hypothetical protein IPK17_36465 [Chloroflexi bacterium]|uniref:hypothetical protein n=1 Tax=Candidatus Flexifilum breve TaxID=3140694 RepID=UPI0031369812|nr:hypothetical protein [Chloroflexota bacterium]
MLRRLIVILTICLFTLPAVAQEALNLPADLFVLLNDGRIERYGVGAAGVRTVTPEGAYIIDFGVDAAGERLAYRTEDGLYITLIPATDVPLGDPIRLEAESASVPYFRGAGETIAWSPTGDALAYTTLTGARVYFQGSGGFVDLLESPMLSLSWSPGGTFLAAQAEQNVWWIYRRDGSLATLTSIIPSSIGTAWVSDSELVFAPADGSLRVMNLAAANAQSILLDDTIQYRLPYLTDEDALVFFARDPEVPEGYGVLMRLQRGATEVETLGQVPVALTGLRWTPDGSLLAAFQGGVIALYDPITGLGFPLPLQGAVAYGWGRPAPETTIAPTLIPGPTQVVVPLAAPTETPLPLATAPAPVAVTSTPAPAVPVTALVLSSDGYFLSPDFNGTLQVWRMPANGAPPGQYTGSLDDVGEYAIAPNDGTVAYVVTGELWIQPFSRAAPYYLTEITSFAPTNLTFSPDGALIAFADEERGIFTVPMDGSEDPSLLIVNAADTIYRRPQFSPDGSRLLVDIYRGDRVWTGVFDLTSKALIEAPVPESAEDTRAARALVSRWSRLQLRGCGCAFGRVGGFLCVRSSRGGICARAVGAVRLVDQRARGSRSAARRHPRGDRTGGRAASCRHRPFWRRADARARARRTAKRAAHLPEWPFCRGLREHHRPPRHAHDHRPAKRSALPAHHARNQYRLSVARKLTKALRFQPHAGGRDEGGVFH